MEKFNDGKKWIERSLCHIFHRFQEILNFQNLGKKADR